MRKGIAVVTLAALMVPTPRALATDHLVSPAQVGAALSAAQAGRTADLQRLEGVLSTPGAQRAAARLGADLGAMRSALPALDDEEIRALAERSARLDRDPAAGLSHDVEQLLIIFLVVALVLLVLKSVN